MDIHHSYVRKSGFIAGVRCPTYCLTCQHFSLVLMDAKMSSLTNTLYCFAIFSEMRDFLLFFQVIDPDNPFGCSDAVRILLLQFSSLLVEQASPHIHDAANKYVF